MPLKNNFHGILGSLSINQIEFIVYLLASALRPHSFPSPLPGQQKITGDLLNWLITRYLECSAPPVEGADSPLVEQGTGGTGGAGLADIDAWYTQYVDGGEQQQQQQPRITEVEDISPGLAPPPPDPIPACVGRNATMRTRSYKEGALPDPDEECTRVISGLAVPIVSKDLENFVAAFQTYVGFGRFPASSIGVSLASLVYRCNASKHNAEVSSFFFALDRCLLASKAYQ